MTRVFGVIALVLGIGVLASWRAEPDGFTTVYVVRHAEAENAGDDPGLTDAGAARSLALADLLRSAEIDAVYSTGLRRSLETATPSVEGHTKAIIGYEPKATDQLAEDIAGTHAGETVLVVGHSNTVPLIVASLGGGEIEPISHDEHDNLYVVTIARTGEVGLQRLRLPDE
jgi:broad specificity phosphatase PhoE